MSEKTTSKRGRPKKQEEEIPEAVINLAKKEGEAVDGLLGWKVYDDRVVIIGATGKKFSEALDG